MSDRAMMTEFATRIERALACHYPVIGVAENDWRTKQCECGHDWDLERDRCSSPTVAALMGDE